jgi:hypothetical protein
VLRVASPSAAASRSTRCSPVPPRDFVRFVLGAAQPGLTIFEVRERSTVQPHVLGLGLGMMGDEFVRTLRQDDDAVYGVALMTLTAPRSILPHDPGHYLKVEGPAEWRNAPGPALCNGSHKVRARALCQKPPVAVLVASPLRKQPPFPELLHCRAFSWRW